MGHHPAGQSHTRHPRPPGRAPGLLSRRASLLAILVAGLTGCDDTRLVTCKDNSDCSQGYVCDLAVHHWVCDGTTIHPTCAKSMDARSAGPETMASDALSTDDVAFDGPLNADISADAGARPDAAEPDTATPDTRPVQCTTSTQCPGNAPICSSNTCAACTAASQCLAKDPNTSVCATSGAAAGQCVQCTDNTACKAMSATPACNTVKNKRVECTGYGQLPGHGAP